MGRLTKKELKQFSKECDSNTETKNGPVYIKHGFQGINITHVHHRAQHLDIATMCFAVAKLGRRTVAKVKMWPTFSVKL